MAGVSAGLSANAQLGSLTVYALSGTAALAGLPTATVALAVMAVGYTAGRFMDRRGRRGGLVLGFAVGAVGAASIAAAVAAKSLVGYIAATAVFSVGIAGGQLSRAAVADMYPASRRAGAVGLVITGGLLGGLTGPMLVALGHRIAHSTGADALAVPWAFILGTFGVAGVALSLLRPDPREIGRRLNLYYPDAGLEPDAAHSPGLQESVVGILGLRVTQAAVVALACAQAAMVIIMSTSSLMMSFHGHSVEMISLALMAHVTGMCGFSIPVGRLADRIGRRPVLITGALLTAAGGLMFTLGIHLASVALVAFYLVGLGWCLAFVAGSAVLGDVSTAATRARVIGISEVLTYASSMAAALTSGLLLARGGEVMVGMLAAVLGTIPLLAIMRAGPERHRQALGVAPADAAR